MTTVPFNYLSKKWMFIFIFFLSIIQIRAQEYTTILNIPYYNDSIRRSDNYIAERCMLDIHYPENMENFATIVWFHGGSLTGGNKSIPTALKEKGFCVVAVNYRLHPHTEAPEYIKDAAAAVSWVFKNIKKYGGDDSKIFVSGVSAGGYLVSMIGLDKQWLSAHNIDADKIAGIIPLTGQMITHFTIRKENGIPEKQPTIDHYAPLYHVRSNAPPLILITGDRELEMLGRYEENAYLMRMMKVSGHSKTKLYEIGGYGHNITDAAIPIVIREVRKIIKENQQN